MRRKKILDEGHSLVLARIVTDLCLPAMIFISLSDNFITIKQFGPALEMLFLELFCIILAWFISIKMKFSRPAQGAIVFCSAFGSSTFLGYPLISQIFPDNPEALAETVLISEIGVGYPIFILGPILASYFGSNEADRKALVIASMKFFKSPVFYSLLAGLIWGHFHLPGKENELLAPVFQTGEVLASALTPLAILSIGLMFRMPPIRKILLALGLVVAIKLLLKPYLAGSLAGLLGFPELWKDLVIILASMPPAILGAVFVRRYGGDSTLASALVISASIISIFTLLLVFYLLL